MPAKDTSQDWTLLQAGENNYGTMLKMVRKLNTCDDQDVEILVRDCCYILHLGSSLEKFSLSVRYMQNISKKSKRLYLHVYMYKEIKDYCLHYFVHAIFSQKF